MNLNSFDEALRVKDVSIVDEAITNDFEGEGTSLNTNEKSDDLVPSSDVITIKKDVAVLTLKRTKSSVILPYIASTEKETVLSKSFASSKGMEVPYI